jgi:hypothetical protein
MYVCFVLSRYELALSPLALKIKNISNEPATTRNLESQNETISTTATSRLIAYIFYF